MASGKPFVGDRKFNTILADPPWQFTNRTGKIAPEHKRLSRYGTMTLTDIQALPVARAAAETSHLYNIISTRKREHSRKPDEQYRVITSCSPGPYLEMFARGERPGWTIWGNQADESYVPTWPTYSNHSRGGAVGKQNDELLLFD